MSSAYGHYRQMAIQTAPPEQLVVMLYDGLIRDLEQAKAALSENQDATKPVEHAQDIILELASALNHSAGEISENLARLYDFWLNWLVVAQAKRDIARVEEVLSMARELREAWGIITQQKRSGQTKSAGAGDATTTVGSVATLDMRT